jgi:hypothetical protein
VFIPTLLAMASSIMLATQKEDPQTAIVCQSATPQTRHVRFGLRFTDPAAGPEFFSIGFLRFARQSWLWCY